MRTMRLQSARRSRGHRCGSSRSRRRNNIRLATLHRTRQLLVRQRTMLSNALRGHLAELGIVSAKGRNGTAELFRIIADSADSRVSPAVRGILEVLARQHSAIGAEIASIDKSIMALHRGGWGERRAGGWWRSPGSVRSALPH